MQHIEPEPDWRGAIQRRLERLRFEPVRVEEIVDELTEHLQDRYAELIAGGRGREEAVRETLAELDDDEGLLAELAQQPRRLPELVSEGGARQWQLLSWVRAFVAELRLAARLIRRSPGFAGVAIVTLALGIGANTAVFSLLDAVLLRPLPFPQPDRLVRVDATKDGRPIFEPSALDVRDYARENRTFESLFAYSLGMKTISGVHGSTEAQQQAIGFVPAAYFETLGIQPLLGRFFTDEENQFGKHHVLVINRSFWQSRLNGDPSAIGQTLRVENEPFTIVGVIPDVIPEWVEGEALFPAISVWMPFAPTPNVWSETNRGTRGYRTIGRMKPGVTLAQAEADLARIATSLAARYPEDRGFGVHLRSFSESREGSLRPVLLMLMGAVTFVLLIACANAANLLLARQAVRGRELAVRAALGAGRAALVRQLLAETVLLAGLGGTLGIFLAWLGCLAVTRLRPDQFPQLAASGIDQRVLGFTLIASLVTGLLFGVAPAFTSTRANLTDALRAGARAGEIGAAGQRFRRVLVTTEIALALMLAIGAALLAQSIFRLQHQDMGYPIDHLLSVRVALPDTEDHSPAHVNQVFDQLIARVRALPGVREASVAANFPPVNRSVQGFTLDGRPSGRVEDVPLVTFYRADDHFLRTLGSGVVAGRDFAATDTESSGKVALVNEAFVRRYLPDANPVGRHLRVGLPDALIAAATSGRDPYGAESLTIVGVKANTKNAGLARAALPEIVVLSRQIPRLNYWFKGLLVRTAGDPYAAAPAIRAQLRELDAQATLTDVTTMEEVVGKLVADSRFVTVLLGIFALLGVSLAITGVYGVISYLVAQRTPEIGVRVALGATRGRVFWLVIRQMLATGLAGVAFGLLGAWAARRTLAQLVFGVSTLDATTYALAAVLLLLVAVAASAVPARRALRIDPVSALRRE